MANSTSKLFYDLTEAAHVNNAFQRYFELNLKCGFLVMHLICDPTLPKSQKITNYMYLTLVSEIIAEIFYIFTDLRNESGCIYQAQNRLELLLIINPNSPKSSNLNTILNTPKEV